MYFRPQAFFLNALWGHVGSSLPHQGWSLRPLQGKFGLNHGTAERPPAFLAARPTAEAQGKETVPRGLTFALPSYTVALVGACVAVFLKAQSRCWVYSCSNLPFLCVDVHVSEGPRGAGYLCVCQRCPHQAVNTGWVSRWGQAESLRPDRLLDQGNLEARANHVTVCRQISFNLEGETKGDLYFPRFRLNPSTVIMYAA